MSHEISKEDVKKAMAIIKTTLAGKGLLDGEKNADEWDWYTSGNLGVARTLEIFEDTFRVQFYKLNTRAYMVPEDDERLFFKNALSFNDIQNVQERNLARFLTIYLMVLFFSGEGDNKLSRDFITLEEYKIEVDGICAVMTGETSAKDDEETYHEDFKKMAHLWLSKYESDSSEYTRKTNTYYGLLTRVAVRLEGLGLMELERINEENAIGRILPTRRWIDLAGFVLRKDRAQHLHSWLYAMKAEGEEGQDAKN